MLDQDARKRVSRPARRERHDNGDGSRRISLCPRCERPRDSRASERRYEFSSSNVACHVTLRVGVIHAWREGTIASLARWTPMGKSGEAPRITAEVRRDKLRPNKIFPPRPDNGPSRLRCKNLKAYLLLLCGEFLIFFVITFIVSNFYENLSILTGFPFGHYHYTETLGPKLFLVPLLIAPAYFG